LWRVVEEEKISAAMTASTALERESRAKYEHNTGTAAVGAAAVR
jgi:hypothetical protein